MTTKLDMPPVEFSNLMYDLNDAFDWNDWRKSPEWRLFVCGYNAAVKEANQAVISRYNLGENAERIFEKH